jgi:(p)ppGpp synthase/HD superfamily hydrolase
LVVGDAKNAPALAGAEDELVEATRLAWQWHGRQTRKGRSSSYMSHLLQVQGLVIDAGGDAIQSIAALLHDSLEDAPTARDRAEREALIATRFDPAVLQIVIDCTDTTAAESADDKGPWRERKERYLAQLRIAAPSSLLVAACDKRHNLGDLIRDLRQEGLETLSRFNAGGVEQLWYFESLSAICGPAIPDRLARELDDLVRALRAIVETGTIDGD